MSGFLLAFLVRSTLLGALGWLAVALLRRRSPALRHAVLVGTIGGMLVLPLIGSLAPPRRVEIDRAPPALAYLAQGFTAPPDVSRGSMPAFPPEAPLYAWAVVTVLLWARLGVGFVRMRWRARRAEDVLPERTVRVAEDAAVPVPMAVWAGEAVVLLPRGWAAWPPERLAHVLAHEEAHVLRGDWFTQTFVQASVALMWPSPLAHMLARRARSLAEEAADDLVVAGGADRCAYATSLLAIARAATNPAWGVPMASKPDVARRIELILRDSVERTSLTRRAAIVVGLVVLTVSAAVATFSLAQGREAFAGGFGSATPLMILAQGDVQSDLALSADQVRRIDAAVGAYRRRLRDDPSDRQGIAAELLSALDAVLGSAERARLREIFVQWRGVDAILDADVQDHLDVAPAQRSRIREIAAEYLRSRDAAIYAQDLGAVLTPAQARKLEQLGGRRFSGRILGTIWSQGG